MHSGSPPARRPLTALALLGAVIALLLGGAGPASAHAVLTASDPADKVVLKTAPRQVTLTFTESVSFRDASLRVLSPDNERVNPRPAQHADGKKNTAQVTLQNKLAQGTYTVAWRVVSADSHPISGAFTFSIGKPSETAVVAVADSPDDTAASRVYGIVRYVAYSGLALLVGVAAFVLFCWPAASAARPVRRLLVAGWATLLASTVALLLLRGPYEEGSSISSALDLSLLGRSITGRTGTALSLRLVLLALAAVLMWRTAVRTGIREEGTQPRPTGSGARWAGAVLAVGLAATWAAAEHASAGIQVPLAVPVAVLHLLAMAVWLGGLITLLTVLRRRVTERTEIPVSAVVRFSTLAFTAVVVLVGTGLYQSWRQVGSVEALSTTSYGRTLVLKTVAVVVMVCAASFSRQWAARLVGGTAQAADQQQVPEPERVPVAQAVGASVVPGTTGSDSTADVPAERESFGDAGQPFSVADRQRRSLRRTVAVEAVLGVVVLAVTTVLTGSQPSRAAAESAAALAAQQAPAKLVVVPFDMGKPNNRGRVQITLAPGRVGENTVEAVAYAFDNGIVTIPEIRLTLTHKERGIGPLDAKLKDQQGYWAAYDLRVPMAGVWTMNVTVRATDVDQVTVTKTVTITDVTDTSTS
ncbi:copper resistance protein CopC/CopD (plasmid) [Streptomyces sp. NBC_00637]|uniref:copper resistance CopC/CopD family protein n=1 Tax=Streptomyces sp. NBC_00637 TaxID=2903667 RepID=UPI002F914D23